MNYNIEAMKTRVAAVILVFLASACVIQRAAEPEGASDAAVAPPTKGELKAEAKPDAEMSQLVQQVLPAKQQRERHAGRTDEDDVKGNEDVGGG